MFVCRYSSSDSDKLYVLHIKRIFKFFGIWVVQKNVHTSEEKKIQFALFKIICIHFNVTCSLYQKATKNIILWYNVKRKR